MANGAYGLSEFCVWSLLDAESLGSLDDAQLLERFVAKDGQGADAAFAALVERHGPLVLRTCRARLRDEHAAHDAFQATFLVLATRAASLRVQETLAPWLHSVAWRVASSARSDRARRRRHEQRAAELASLSVEPRTFEDSELALHQEIDRLPERQRLPLILCGLSGISTEQAARQLGWPVGTVRSRLSRGKERLRERLTRRGLAPSLLIFSSATGVRSRIPAILASEAIRNAILVSSGKAISTTAPVAIAALASSTLWSLMMRNGIRTAAATLALGLSVTSTAVVIARAGDDGPQVTQTQEVQTTSKLKDSARAPSTSSPTPSIASQFETIKAEYDAKQQTLRDAIGKAESPPERNRLYTTMSPDEQAFSRRMLDLASTAPKDRASRDALLWVIDKPNMSQTGHYGEEFARAAARLVRDHGDDPDAVRIGIGMDNDFSIHKDQILTGFVASSKSPESKGLARLALAQYLERKAMFAKLAQKQPNRRSSTWLGVLQDDGTTRDITEELSDEEYAYDLLLRQCSPDQIRAEAERLYEEVIQDYADIPCLSHRIQQAKALINQPIPKLDGKPISAENVKRLREMLASTPSLGEVAADHLDQMRNLVAGKLAPEFEGLDVEGKPMKLSDFKGKVVALSFWGSWCGPCLRDIPQERELVEAFKGRPFALLGVNCGDSREKAAEVMKSERMTWPSWHDGETAEGPIAHLYHISGFPTVIVIDAEGKLRSTKARGERLAQLVEELVRAAEARSRLSSE